MLRDRRFGVVSEDAPLGAPHLSFLTMNPPEHDRLRRFAVPSLSARSVAAQRTARYALHPVEPEGRTLGRGDVVVIMLGGANRDPAVFGRPDDFDLDRDGHEHVAFSAGIRYCIGAALARLEAMIAIQALATRFPGLRRSQAPERRPGSLIRGLRRLEVQTSSSAVRAIA